jgi:hypothetical protein
MAGFRFQLSRLPEPGYRKNSSHIAGIVLTRSMFLLNIRECFPGFDYPAGLKRRCSALNINAGFGNEYTSFALKSMAITVSTGTGKPAEPHHTQLRNPLNLPAKMGFPQ